MPRGDGTGPIGMGPMTGRGLGYCAPAPRRVIFGPRGGFGWRHRYYATGVPGSAVSYGKEGAYTNANAMDPESEKEFLRNQMRVLEGQLEEMNAQLNALEKDEE